MFSLDVMFSTLFTYGFNDSYHVVCCLNWSIFHLIKVGVAKLEEGSVFC